MRERTRVEFPYGIEQFMPRGPSAVDAAVTAKVTASFSAGMYLENGAPDLAPKSTPHKASRWHDFVC